MAQIINTNIASLNAQRNLNNSQSANSTALERLSSGLRINSAKDDAAGLAISTKFESQTRGLNQAIRNAGDGISLAQTAEGALGTMTDNLQRIRELSVQSANATNSDDDRAALQQEVSALVAEVTRTADETNFNGRNLFDGNFNGTFQIGANAGQTVDVQIGELTASKLGVGDATGVSAIGTGEAIQNGDLTINGVSIEPSKANSDTASIVNAGASAIAKVDAINQKSDETGVTAQVNTTVSSGVTMEEAQTSGTVSLNGVDISVSTGGVDLQADRESVISAINAKSEQTGVVATNGGDSGGVILEASDGRNITVEFKDFGADSGDDEKISTATGLNGGTNNVSGDDDRVTSYGGFTLVSDDGSNINLEGGSGTGTGNIANAGLTAGVFSGKEAAVTSLSRNVNIQTEETKATFTTGDMSIVDPTVINATNNTFEISLDGVNDGDFSLVTIGNTYDVGSGVVGEYDDAAQLADAINQSIEDTSDGGLNAAFRDAEGNALFTASANDLGTGLVFETVSKGEAASIVVRSGQGSLDIPTEVSRTSGLDGGTFIETTLGFTFDGSKLNVEDTGGDIISLDITGGSGAGTAIDLDLNIDKTYTEATDFAADLNTAITGSTLNGLVQAVVTDDGKQVKLQSTEAAMSNIAINNTNTTVITSDVEASSQKLSNGDTVITEVSTFAGSYSTGVTDTFSLEVDGQPALDLQLDFAATTAYADANAGSQYDAASTANGGAITDAAVLAAVIQYAADTQIAGSGITAEAVGDQVVLSSKSGGSVDIGYGSSQNITGATIPDITASAVSNYTVSDTQATATTGSFSNVSDGSDGFAEGTFVSTDFDGSSSLFESKAAPLQIETGVNDTFSLALDGGALTDVVIASDPDGYATTEELATAIQTGLDSAFGAGSVQVDVDADDASKLVFTSLNATANDGRVVLQDGSVDGNEGAFAISGAASAGEQLLSEVQVTALKSGDLVINGTAIGAASAQADTSSDTTALTSDAAASGIATAAAINASSEQTGVTAEVNATTMNGGDTTVDATGDAKNSVGSVYINNVESGSIQLTGEADRDRASAIDAINSISGQTGVVAEDNGESITLIAADGRNISVAIDTKLAENSLVGRDSSNFGSYIGLSSSQPGIGEGDFGGTSADYANTAKTTYSTVTLKSAGEISIENGVNGTSAVEDLGLRLGSYGGSESGTFLEDVDISTFQGAQDAITAIDNALETVASQRAELGALQNRFESTVSNLAITAENLTAANSRIRDADFAAETAELSRTQVLQQAGISILAQANQRPQQVLSLLG